jgi:ribosomal protein S18 acetylase RimI-like enzyme
MKVDICLAEKKDAAVVADLSRQTFLDTFASQNTKEDMEKFMNEQFTRQMLMKEVGVEGHLFYIARVNESLAGYVKLREGKEGPELKNRRSLEIARIYAVKEMLGKGVGSALMQKAIDVATERNKEILWLAVFQANKTAIDFYKRWGFEIFGEQDFLLGNDLQKDWLMRKMLIS